jgi:PAS domain S-box-containing protein
MTNTGDNKRRDLAGERLKSDRRFADSIIDCLPNIFYVFDEAGRFAQWNQAAEAFTGLTAEEMAAAHPLDLVAVRDRSKVRETIAKVFEQGRASIDAHLLSGGGEDLLHRLTGVRMESGGKRYLVGVGVDVSGRKRVEQELRAARDVAEAANRAKSGFLAAMNHELRTPLNAIIGFSQVLQDETFGPLNPKQAKYVGNVLSSGRALLALIDDILDLSEVDADPKSLEPTPFEVGPFLENALLLVREKAVKHGISLNADIPADVGMSVVEADKRKLMQVLHNLLVNAAKFSPDGGSVVLSARRTGPDVIVNLQDTGIGFDPEEAERLFDPFHQADSTAARRYEGSGLGLALCRKYIELHGGRIWARSAGKGKGSTFSFSIPCRPVRP